MWADSNKARPVTSQWDNTGRWMLHFSEQVQFLELPIMKIVEFANSIDPAKAAYNELFHLDLQSLPFGLLMLRQYGIA